MLIIKNLIVHILNMLIPTIIGGSLIWYSHNENPYDFDILVTLFFMVLTYLPYVFYKQRFLKGETKLTKEIIFCFSICTLIWILIQCTTFGISLNGFMLFCLTIGLAVALIPVINYYGRRVLSVDTTAT